MIYSEVINHHLQPKKAKYTMRDFNRLQAIHGAKQARFIIIASAIYHYGVKDASAHYSKIFDSKSFHKKLH